MEGLTRTPSKPGSRATNGQKARERGRFAPYRKREHHFVSVTKTFRPQQDPGRREGGFMSTTKTGDNEATQSSIEAFALGSAAILAQEARGQRELVASCDLPTDCTDDAILRAWGFELGQPNPDDPMFRSAVLPAGWKMEYTNHAMWSKVVDQEGRERVSIFYKAAFYDRSAFMQAKYRFSAEANYGCDPCNVGIAKDCSAVIFRSEPIDTTGRESWDIADAARNIAAMWLDINRPGWRDCAAGWAI